MKRVLVIVALLVGWWSPRAHADYDARKSEAVAALGKAGLSTEERAALQQAFDTYFRGREECFDGLLVIVRKTEEAAQQATFRDRAGVCAVGANQVLGRALDGVKPTDAALKFVNEFISQESSFYEALAKTTVADARDQIVVIRLRLGEMTRALDEKWKALLSDDETLDQRAKSMVEEIRADYRDVIRAAADANKSLAELLLDGVKRYTEVEGAPGPTTGHDVIDQLVSAAQNLLPHAISYWDAKNLRSEERVQKYRSLFVSERRVLVMFKQVRGDVLKFLEDNDFPRADAAYAAAKSTLDTFSSSGKTSGQSRDAAELRDDLMVVLSGHLKDAASIYAAFVDRHEEKFFGAIGPDVKRQLVEHETWDQYARDIDGYALDTKIREWQQQASNTFYVDLSRLKPDARDELKFGLKAVIEQLLEELEEARKTSRDLQRVMHDERKQLERELE